MTDKINVDEITEKIDIDLGLAVERVDSWIDGAIKLLPNIISALIIFIIFIFIAKLINFLVRKYFSRKDKSNLGEVLGGFVKWAIFVLGFLLSATIVTPSLKPGDLIAGLGVSSVAIGFAFKDILQNWLAGLLILFRQPFQVNDQVEVSGYEGTVKKIETRATLIKTFDGDRVVIPNSQIYTNAIKVKTAYRFRRSEYDIGIGYGDDLQKASKIISSILDKVVDIVKEPVPEVLVWDLAASWVTIRARWWTNSKKTNLAKVRSEVITKIKLAFDDAKIDMPYDTKVHLFHDQTEDLDGDRSAQREGWPALDKGSTKPRWQAEKDLDK